MSSSPVLSMLLADDKSNASTVYAGALAWIREAAVKVGVGIVTTLEDMTIRAVEPFDLWPAPNGDNRQRGVVRDRTWITGPLTAGAEHIYVPNGLIAGHQIIVLYGLSVVALRKVYPPNREASPRDDLLVMRVPEEPPGTAVVRFLRGEYGSTVERLDVRGLWDATAQLAPDKQIPPSRRGNEPGDLTISLPGRSYRGWFSEYLLFLPGDPFCVRLDVAHTRPAGDWLMFHGFVAEPRCLWVDRGRTRDATTDASH